jgi:hypothetical protein
MKYYLKFLAFILALNVSSQTLLHTNGKAIVDANGDSVILKTMNLGGWMLIEPYQIQSAGFASAQWELEEKIEQLVGTAEKDIFLENWYANHARKIDIDSLAAWGFNAIRLPMHYNLFTLSIQEEPILGQNTWLTKGFEMTDSLVSWCKQNNMYVVLDLHAAPGGQGGNTGISDYNPSYPSLWEDINNRHKTMSLWKKIAEHYVNEPAIAGYDFLNETNWNLGSNELRNFYTQLTDSVRAVDTNHIIFIEGNWYANDFSGLTPPWDNNMVYSPHKYWSKNYQADIQWALDIRDNWNVPVWFGESGENSNTWFRNAIRLFEDHDLGWAWWPMKKLESISCPMSITKTVDFENLLNYWSSGNNPPSANNAINTLFQLTEDLKLENCTYQKDVIDAMFRQVNSNETKPFDSTQSIPGRIFATDFDMGVLGAAYHDNVYSDYHVTTGSYTAWNEGWSYRNDGADISACNDVYFFHNGYQVGWFEEGEFMQYEVDVDSTAVYDINFRYSAFNDVSKIYFTVNDTAFTESTPLSNTNNWSFWNTATISNVILDAGIKKIRLYSDGGEINLNSFEFVKVGEVSSIDADFISAKTLDDYTIELLLSKPLDFNTFNVGLLNNPNQAFEVHIDNTNNILINGIQYDPNFPRVIQLQLNSAIQGWSTTTGSATKIDVSYSGNQIDALDGTSLAMFSYKPVSNILSCTYNCIPGKIEAENYFFESGISVEGCSDVDGGYNIGYLNTGDYVDYYINAKYSGSFQVSYRNAADGHNGSLEMQLIDSLGNAITLNTANFTSTGGWQNWQTTNTSEVFWLNKGIHHIRVLITLQEYNLNWFQFDVVASNEKILIENDISVVPNPASDFINIILPDERVIGNLEILDLFGRVVFNSKSNTLNVSSLPNGIYILNIEAEGDTFQKKFIKK